MKLNLNFRSGIPVYLQIAHQIKAAAASGALRDGDALPSVRVLAEDLRINRNTAAKAYAELESEGVIETRMGKGKGEPEYWAAVVKPGMILYEIGGVTEDAARLCLSRLAHKMPLRVRFVKRRVM
jgi:ribosomal protein L16/L10AE